MRCKKHLSDFSSDQGVCASCLRQRLNPILAVQSGDHPPPLINDQNRHFHNTPQLGPVNPIACPIKKERTGFSLFRPNRTAASSPLPSWLSEFFSGKERKEQSRIRGRGMSPERVPDCDGDSPETGRRGGRGRGLGTRDVVGFAFCISPLVWVRPKGNVKSKSMPKEVTVVPVKPQLTTAASFCKNKSRKIADFGRYRRRH